jgi:hypothetical protein
MGALLLSLTPTAVLYDCDDAVKAIAVINKEANITFFMVIYFSGFNENNASKV